MPLIVALATAWAGSAGVSGGALAFRGPVRHSLQPEVGGWLALPAGPLAFTTELRGSSRTRASVESLTSQARISIALGKTWHGERASTGFGLGPGLSTRFGSTGGSGFVVVEPTVRGLGHLTLGVGKTPLRLRYQMGFETRGLAAWDFDLLLGVGVGW